MPPRLNKRQLRELQELEDLERAKQHSQQAASPALPTADEVDSSEEEAVGVRESKAGGGFRALVDDGDEQEDDDEEKQDDEVVQPVKSKKSKNKKKKKKPASAAAVLMPGDEPEEEEEGAEGAVSPPTETPVTPSGGGGGGGKKKKKKGGKGTPAPTAKKEKVDDGMDEIDRALAELAVKNKGKSVGGDGGNGEEEKVWRVEPKWVRVKESFAIDPKHLDSEAELRRMFGSRVIGSAPQAPRQTHLHARLANNPHHAASLRRTSSFLATPEPGWPSPAGVLQLKKYEGPEAQQEKERGGAGEWWTFVHDPSYKQAQLMFLEVLQQADGNRLYDVLAALPYHVDTHMQLSEMMAQQGDLGASSTHLTRALYALSAPLPSTFPSGSFRLPYSQIENRALYLAIARKVALLVKRGTWRTAFEWAKIGLGIGGDADPVGMMCWLDFLAPKASQNDWFFKLLNALDEAYPDMRVQNYPGVWFAKALCVRNQEEAAKENNEKSTAALKSAILRFPLVATLLSNAVAFDLPPSLVTHRRAQPDGSFTHNPSYVLSLLSELYVARSAPLWKDPASVAWLSKTVRDAAGSIDDQSLEDVREGEWLWSEGPWGKGVAPEGVVRAAFMSDLPSIRPYLPPSARAGTTYSYDPLPPQSPIATFYSDAYFSSLYTSGRRRPGAAAAQGGQGGRGDMVAAMRDGLARLLGLGAEGPQVDLNPELRARLLEELEALNAGGGMPGGFGEEGDEGEEGEWEEEEGGEEGEGEGNEEERQEANRNLLGRLGALFGGGGGAGGGAAT
ncbi:hypothetical protein JCM8547_001618 [Rhodosporidiobolus lusitaniae]